MSTINDGFGDDLTVDEYIEANERLLKIKAADRTRGNSSSSDIWDDVLQEGRIVQWELMLKRPGSARAYVSAAMSNRIRDCITRGTWTGMPRAQGKERDPLRRSLLERDSVDDPDVETVISSGDWVDQVLLGYHQGQILQALAALTFTQREYCVLRFWGGWSNQEIAERRGIRKQEVERQWRVNIRPQLAEQLGSLAGM